jgi:hypothetical protein
VVCVQRPPETLSGAPTEFGVLDKKRGLLPGEVLADGAVQFDLDVTALIDGAGRVVIVGPLAHGSPADRFLYLGWRPIGGGKDEWIRRWKISLNDIPRASVDDLAASQRLSLRIGEGGLDRVWLDGDWTNEERDRDGSAASL